MAAAARVAAAAGGNDDAVTNRELLRGSGSGRFTNFYERFMFGSVRWPRGNIRYQGLADQLSTACASGATAIQLGVEAIRRGEAMPRSASARTDRSIRNL
jgi:3-oxoacyl-[acyl-carrier-protein] synthase II